MGLPKFALTNGAANYSYCRARPELGYAVESSTNLFLWSTSGVSQGQGTNVSTTASAPVTSAPAQFFRLRVNAP
jgi:hypothetical protein